LLHFFLKFVLQLGSQMDLILLMLEIFNFIEYGHKKLIGSNLKIGIVYKIFRNIIIIWIILY